MRVASPDWLRSLPGETIELYCKCDPHIAADRFFARKRHAGHLDGSKSRAEELAKFEQFALYGSLGIGRLVEVDTERSVELDTLLRQFVQPGTRLSISSEHALEPRK